MDDINTVLIVVSALAALAYGLIMTGQAPSLQRTVVKVAAVGAIAVIAFFSNAPWLLAAGLLLCVVGDGFLAGDPHRPRRTAQVTESGTFECVASRS